MQRKEEKKGIWSKLADLLLCDDEDNNCVDAEMTDQQSIPFW